jgi:hypothetical protein
MVEENTNIFEEAEDVSDAPFTNTTESDGDSYSDVNETFEEFRPKLHQESPQARLERTGKKENADGRILTIKEYFFTAPKTKDKDGNPIAPEKTINKVEFYGGKLGIRFEEDNLVEYYPRIRYFVKDGKMSDQVNLHRDGDSAISKIIKQVGAKCGKPLATLSDKEILDFLVGKKVKIVTEKGTYQGKNWFRNDFQIV